VLQQASPSSSGSGDPVVDEYVIMGLGREAVSFAVLNYGMLFSLFVLNASFSAINHEKNGALIAKVSLVTVTVMLQYLLSSVLAYATLSWTLYPFCLSLL
jgi:hypothetical protein